MRGQRSCARVGVTRATFPALSVFGFAAIGFMPTISLLIAYQVLRRARSFALSRPGREGIHVRHARRQYKAKSFIERSCIGRSGRRLLLCGARLAGLTLTGTSFVAVPLATVWCGINFWLGKKQVAQAPARGLQSPAS